MRIGENKQGFADEVNGSFLFFAVMKGHNEILKSIES